jgi:hypothetical protein
MRLQFSVTGVTRYGPKVDPETQEITAGDIHTITLLPTAENEAFFEGAPQGGLTLTNLKPEYSDRFEMGTNVVVDLT